MYDIIKNIIENGIFKVNDLSVKIDTLWAESKLSDDERSELVQMMTGHLNPATEAPDIADRLERLESRLSKVEEDISALQGESTEPGLGEVTIPEWEPWDGVSNKYQYGAVVLHNGKYFQNVLSGQQNVWEPESAGVDERYWKEITKEEAESIIGGELL